MSLWNDVKRNLSELYTTTSEKSSEIARITSRRYDKFGISREIERQFSELGNFVYTGLKEEREDLLEDPVARELIERISGLEDELRAKDDEISDIKEAYAAKMASEAGSDEAGASDEAAGDATDEFEAAAGDPSPTSEVPAAATVLTDPVLDVGSDESAILVEPLEMEDSADAEPERPREES